MNNGWIKLHRKILASRVFQNEGLLKVWMWCLLRATHKTNWTTLQTGRGMVEVKLQPGQFIFGRNSAAKELKMKPSTIRNRIKKLKNIENLDIVSNNQYSIITVLNWDSYNTCIKNMDSEKDYQRTTKGQPKDTNKNVKNVKNKGLVPDDFKLFWDAYPKKTGKKNALDSWSKLSKNGMPSVEILLTALEYQKSSPDWKKEDGQFIPYPATWLNGKRWEDEVKKPISTFMRSY